MKIIFSLIILLKSISATAEISVLVATPGLSENTYREILTERKDLISPAQQALEKYQAQEPRSEIFSLADQCFLKKRCDSFAKNFEKLREQFLISPQERQLLVELWEKSGRTKDCYWQPSATCGLKKLNLEKLGLDKDQSYVVFIDGLVYKPGEQELLFQRAHGQISVIFT